MHACFNYVPGKLNIFKTSYADYDNSSYHFDYSIIVVDGFSTKLNRHPLLECLYWNQGFYRHLDGSGKRPVILQHDMRPSFRFCTIGGIYVSENFFVLEALCQL